uniref:(northern house mosquito) hypothetical protein n=1 Tax=Culex pipiens TaxID=7175 RepID=A0A8D8HVF7_CULPI
MTTSPNQNKNFYIFPPQKKNISRAANCNNFLRIFRSHSPEQAFALAKLPLSLACCASFSDSIPINRSVGPRHQLGSCLRYRAQNRRVCMWLTVPARSRDPTAENLCLY